MYICIYIYIHTCMSYIYTINSVKNWSSSTFRHQIEGRKFSSLFSRFQKQSQSKHVWVHHSFKKNKTIPNHKSNSNICTWPQKRLDNFQFREKKSSKSSWWFFPTQLKNMIVKLDHFPSWSCRHLSNPATTPRDSDHRKSPVLHLDDSPKPRWDGLSFFHQKNLG